GSTRGLWPRGPSSRRWPGRPRVRRQASARAFRVALRQRASCGMTAPRTAPARSSRKRGPKAAEVPEGRSPCLALSPEMRTSSVQVANAIAIKNELQYQRRRVGGPSSPMAPRGEASAGETVGRVDRDAGLRGDDAALGEIDDMREQRARGGGIKSSGDGVAVDARDHLADAADALAEAIEN